MHNYSTFAHYVHTFAILSQFRVHQASARNARHFPETLCWVGCHPTDFSPAADLPFPVLLQLCLCKLVQCQDSGSSYKCKCCGKASEVLGRGCWLLRAEIHCIRLNRSKTDSWDAKVNWTNGSKGSLCSNSLFVDFILFFFNLRRDFKIDTQLKIILKFPNAWDQTTEGLRLPVIQWL